MVDQTLNLRMMAAQNLVVEISCRNCHRKATMSAGSLWDFYRKEWHLQEMPFRCDNCQSVEVDREARPWPKPQDYSPKPEPPRLVRRL